MKNKLRLPILLLVALALLLLAGCTSTGSSIDGLVLGSSYRLGSGETLNHDLSVVGGNVALDQNSTVNGNVSVLGGNVTIDGTITGDLSVMGGSVNLDSHALVQGSLNSIGGSVRRASGSVVEGKTNSNNPGTLPTMRTPIPQINYNPITTPLMAIFQSLALAALAVVVTLFVPIPLERTGQTVLAAPVASGGVGCLTLIVLAIMTITIILIPISLIGFLVAGLATLFGWIAVGLLVGRQFAVLLKQPWSDPISAGAGTLAVSLMCSALNIIPCIGWIAGVLVGLIGLGAVVLSRLGTQNYPPPFTPSMLAPRPGQYTPPQAPPPGTTYGPESDMPSGTPPSGSGPQA